MTSTHLSYSETLLVFPLNNPYDNSLYNPLCNPALWSLDCSSSDFEFKVQGKTLQASEVSYTLSPQTINTLVVVYDDILGIFNIGGGGVGVFNITEYYRDYGIKLLDSPFAELV